MAKDYARSFYDSQAWRKTREAYLQSKHYICEDCGGAASVVHHIAYIKPWNVNDPNITLNWDNLKAVCIDCHAKEHSQDLKQRSGGARLNGIAFDEEGNVIKQSNVFLVCGSPASGKTTYVTENKSSRDLVIDLDYICAALAGEAGTIHVETVVLLSHKKPDSYIHIDVEFGEGEGKIPVDKIVQRAEKYKPKERVTYKRIKEYILEKYGFKVHTAYIAEVKRSLGLPMYDAPNAVEELKQPRKHPTPEKIAAIKDALQYFAVI